MQTEKIGLIWHHIQHGHRGLKGLFLCCVVLHSTFVISALLLLWFLGRLELKHTSIGGLTFSC